jgi:hypothetical protein
VILTDSEQKLIKEAFKKPMCIPKPELGDEDGYK